MPTITLYPQAKEHPTTVQNALPQLLQTPSGLAIVEIQGTVNSTLESAGDTSTPIGELSFPHYDPSKPDDMGWQKRVYLYVGKHQRLTGEVKKLSRPIAVIRRRQESASSSLPPEERRSETDDLEIAEIVYHKILFAHRPEPVGGSGGGN